VNPSSSIRAGNLSGRISGSGLELAYREWNSDAHGLPLVLLHGITGSSADWQRVAEHLPARRIIALDARGHGRSDWAFDEAYGGDQHFADVACALANLGIEQCVLAGYSMGGGVAIMTAAAIPERVAGAVVVDAYPHPTMSPGSSRIARWVARFDGPPRFDPAIARQFQDQLAEGRESRLDLWSLWEAIECPVLVVRGAQSDVLTARSAADMLSRLPVSRVVTIDDVSHPIPFVRPGELAAVLETFVRELEARPSSG